MLPGRVARRNSAVAAADYQPISSPMEPSYIKIQHGKCNMRVYGHRVRTFYSVIAKPLGKSRSSKVADEICVIVGACGALDEVYPRLAQRLHVKERCKFQCKIWKCVHERMGGKLRNLGLLSTQLPFFRAPKNCICPIQPVLSIGSRIARGAAPHHCS